MFVAVYQTCGHEGYGSMATGHKVKNSKLALIEIIYQRELSFF